MRKVKTRRYKIDMMQRCNACNLHECAYQQVKTGGNCAPEECELLIVGDYPRSEDDMTGYPLSGDQYKFLWDLLNQVGVKYQVTYLIRCIPIDKYSRRYRKPDLYEYESCMKAKLYQEIETLRPKCVLALGQAALDAIVYYGNVIDVEVAKDNKIGEFRERAHHLKIGIVESRFLATYHPAYVMSSDNDMFYDRFVEDVVYACRHAMVDRDPGKYKSMTISAEQFSRIANIWTNDPTIKYVSFDTETNGLNPWIKGSKITSFSVSVDGLTGYNVFCYHPELEISDYERSIIIDAAKQLLTSKEVIVHHAKHEHRYVKTCWRFTPNITEDTMYMSYILFMGYPGMRHGLKYLSGRFASLPPWEEYVERYVDLYKTMKRSKNIDDDKVEKWKHDFSDIDFTKEEAYKWFSILKDPDYYIRQAESAEDDVFMWMIPTRVMEKYAGMDAIAPIQLMKVLKPMIEADSGLLSAYNMIVRAAEVFANIELAGVRLEDRKRWISIYEEHLQKALERIRSYPEVKQLELEQGSDYNPASAVQTKKLFFEKFRFPVKATTGKGEPSTSEVVLIDLIKEYREKEDAESKRKAEFLFTYREYKKLTKLLSAYFVGLEKFAHYNDSFDGFNCEYLPVPEGQQDEMIHPGYMIHGTITGRLSSQNPSLHTIPYRSDVKKMIVPREHKRGGIYVMADQSQLEIRVLACIIEKYYGDSSLAQAYREGRDIHKYNASKIFKKEMDDVVDAERRFAKTISFSLLYGASEVSVSESTGRTMDEVKQLFQQFYEAFPGIKKYIDATHQYASQYGCVRTPLGRVKYLLDALNPNDRKKYSDALRMAQNSIIQSSGSDLSLRSINYLDNYFRSHNMKSKIVGFIHDSIEVDAAPGEWVESLRLLKYAMKDYNEDLEWVTCPLKIDCSLSDNLGDETKVEEITDNPDGSHTITIKGYSYVIDNIVAEAKFSYEVLEDELIEEHEFLEDPGDLVARKASNLSYDGKTFMEQERKITLLKKGL